ncbi:MAG: carboxypeptidase-like regulatory domain-containing protein, partial [Prevotellaceae bacterium]|nr:carboxypeptidase-like regulatory domain-containing protein [Prevotellaceae bacterium]
MERQIRHIIRQLLAITFLCCIEVVKAQETIVVGQVLDENRNPLSAVGISFKDSKIYTQSNEEGYFLIRNR